MKEMVTADSVEKARTKGRIEGLIAGVGVTLFVYFSLLVLIDISTLTKIKSGSGGSGAISAEITPDADFIYEQPPNTPGAVFSYEEERDQLDRKPKTDTPGAELVYEESSTSTPGTVLEYKPEN